MIVLISVVLLILTAAIVLLFAMLGELATRVPEPEQPWIHRLEDVPSGRTPAIWPSELGEIPLADRPVVLVLSTACASCRGIAARLNGHTDWDGLAIVVSTSTADNGRSFISEFQLGSFPHYIDENGEWSRTQLGVDSSPTAVVFQDGRTVSMYTFSDPATLRTHMLQQPDGGTDIDKLGKRSK